MKKLAGFEGKVVAVSKYSNPGAWDNHAMPEFCYTALVVDEGQIKSIVAGHEEVEVDATPELQEIYKTYLDGRLAELNAQRAEEEKRTARKGRVMRVLKGKNKDFVGTVKWVGETKYGRSSLLINEAGVKVFTKPHNVEMITEAPPEITPSSIINTTVKVKMGQNAGKVGLVEWAGMTKFGKVSARIKVEGEEKPVWATLGNLEAVA